jgi:hypothetical protein
VLECGDGLINGREQVAYASIAASIASGRVDERRGGRQRHDQDGEICPGTSEVRITPALRPRTSTSML